jgi:two-component system, OmpR family, response regulator
VNSVMSSIDSILNKSMEAPPATAPGPGPDDQPNAAGGPAILLVEDNEEIRMLLSDTLTLRGYVVVEAQDGRDALLRYEQTRASLVLLDLHLPDMSGWDVLAALRQVDPRIRVLILSGSSTEDLTQKIKESGADGFVPKPFEPPVLLAKVKSLLTGR